MRYLNQQILPHGCRAELIKRTNSNITPDSSKLKMQKCKIHNSSYIRLLFMYLATWRRKCDHLWPPSVTICQLACSPLVPWEPVYTLLYVNHTERSAITTPITLRISLYLPAILNSLITEPLLLPAPSPSIHRDPSPPPHLPSLSPGTRRSTWGGGARRAWNYVSALSFGNILIRPPDFL